MIGAGNSKAGSVYTDSKTLWIISSVIVVMGVFFAGVFSVDFTPDPKTGRPFATLISISSGALALCGMIGFLFGITRTHTIERIKSDDGEGQNYYRYIPNTNLEEISDWLTKIIIGVGLIELKSLGEWLWWFSKEVSNDLTGKEDIATYVVGIILFNSAAGFVLGYLWTRLKYGAAIKSADEKLIEKRLKGVESGLQTLLDNQEADRLVEAAMNFTGSELPGESEITDAIAKAQRHVKARAYWRANDALWRAGSERSNQERKRLGRAAASVLSGLIEADKTINEHPNNFLDQGIAYLCAEEWKKAEDAILEAKSHRESGKIESPYGLIDLSLAVAQIKLQAKKAEIENNIRIALQDPWVEKRWSDALKNEGSLYYWREVIENWAKEESVDLINIAAHTD